MARHPPRHVLLTIGAVALCALAAATVWAAPAPAFVRWVAPFAESRRDAVTLQKLTGLLAVLLTTYSAIGLGGWLALDSGERPPPRHGGSAISRWEWWLAGSVTVVGALFRLHGMSREFSYDELFTAYHFVTADSWRDAVGFLTANNHLLNSVLGRLAWLTLGGGVHGHGVAEWLVRLPSLLIGVATVLLVWRVTRDWAGRTAAIFAGAWMALLPLHVEYSQSARGYAGLAGCALVSNWLFVRLLERPDARTWLGLVAAGTAAVGFHLYGLWVLAAQVGLLAMLALSGATGAGLPRVAPAAFFRAWTALLVIAVLSLALVAPGGVELLRWMALRGDSPEGLRLSARAIGELLGSSGSRLWIILILIATGGLGLGASRGRGRIVVALAVLSAAFPLAILTWRTPRDVYPRFFIYWLPFAVVFGSTALSRAADALKGRPRRTAVLLAAVAVAGWMFCVGEWAVDSLARAETRPGYRAASDLAFSSVGPGTVVCAFGGDAELLRYYGNLIRIVHSEVEFDALTAGASEVRSVFHDVEWSTASEKALAARLRDTMSGHDFVGLTVFVGPAPHSRELRPAAQERFGVPSVRTWADLPGPGSDLPERSGMGTVRAVERR